MFLVKAEDNTVCAVYYENWPTETWAILNEYWGEEGMPTFAFENGQQTVVEFCVTVFGIFEFQDGWHSN